ncbi:sigma-54-dependent Fis family transcriptional regulator [Sulfidibacter corallicola]|uniref:Sigma-54-dependent Fis family transcriptional regulator n=1 Tax=Sulfidibacter corallicola TaxID=2818388 RepID=A0A8A4TXT7_SULCO|nr:sigma-54-dependent Fis family transcriptional regulator [Sulfidibacter corallicola]QTD51345.1 sigma-54-dependent Fis family transcriptional regulator [Sulfidibacter corallicola]
MATEIEVLGENTPRLSDREIRTFEEFVGEIRKRYGENWGFVFDLKDNIAQVLRCIYTDTHHSGLLPMRHIPIADNLSWRSMALSMDEPLFFDKFDLDDPRSFYLQRTIRPRQMAIFQVRRDSNLGLVSMFGLNETKAYLSQLDLTDIQALCQTLLPVYEKMVWRMEQDVLDQATRTIRQKETPIFITELFNRLLESPVLLLRRLDGNTYQAISQNGLEGEWESETLLFNVKRDKDQVFFLSEWGKITTSRAIPADQKLTGIVFKPGHHVLLCLGEVRLVGKTKDNLFHFIEQIEKLLQQKPYQISTLSFLLYLQHWIRSQERDIKIIFQHIIDTLVPFLSADYGTLALYSRERNRLMFVSQAGQFSNPLKDIPLADKEGTPTSISAFVASENKPYLVSDVRRDPYYRAFNPSIRSEMCAPIRVRGEVIGLFSVSSRELEHFSKQDLAKLEFYCDQIGIALFQAGILEKVFTETEEAKKLDQDFKFGFDTHTHAAEVTYNFGNLVGKPTGAMRQTFDAIHRINGSGREDLNVLITGETGSGKEMVSFALHNSSNRGKKPMVVTNFASFGGDPNLIQSELFGHEKGSFSGATHRRIGCIEQAHETTLLIDEVGDIVPSVQIKLLRVLQQGNVKKFQRLGGQETITSNVRILAATHQNLWQLVKEGKFREDLFYRLQTLVVRIPPLRERLEDIPLLAAHFSARYEQKVPGLKITWSNRAMQALEGYSWPGNVRQLEAVINRALVMFAEDGNMTEAAIEQSLAAEMHQRGNEQESGVGGTQLFRQVCDGGPNAFWGMVQQPYRQHEITHANLLALVREALTESKGSYKQAAAMMGIVDKDYNRFLDFLKNSRAKLDYREFRR